MSENIVSGNFLSGKNCVLALSASFETPAGVRGFFVDMKSFQSHYGPGVDSASNRNEYQEHFLGVKAAGA